MKMSEDIRPVTYLKSRTADLLAQVNETRRPVIITQNGEARGVLQDTESYESMKAAIAILNRAWGTPPQSVEISGKDGERLGIQIEYVSKKE